MTEAETPTRYERVLASEIRPGDRVARTRTRDFYEVREVQPTPTSVWLTYTDRGRDRPRLTARWWRVVTIAPPADVIACGARPDVPLCADCIDAYRNGIEPGGSACDDRHDRQTDPSGPAANRAASEWG